MWRKCGRSGRVRNQSDIVKGGHVARNTSSRLTVQRFFTLSSRTGMLAALFYIQRKMFGFSFLSSTIKFLHVLRGSGTSDDLDKFASDDGLTCSVEQDGKPANHVAGVL